MENNKKKKLINIFMTVINIILFGVMVAINALAVILPINGKSTSELSDSYPNLFVPAGITFSIWGIIYILLLIFTIYQLVIAIKGQNVNIEDLIINILFGVTCILNVFWILAWHYEQMFLSVVIMISLLITLCYLFLRVDSFEIKGIMRNIGVKIPISVYLGWISVATIANISAMLVYLKWNGFGIPQDILTIVMIMAGAILAILSLVLKKNISYALVIVWAYYGIILKRKAASVVYNDIIYACYISIAVIVLIIVVTWVKKIIVTEKKI